MAKLQAYQLQDQGLDTIQANERLGFKADYRDYRLPAEILKFLGIEQVRLISNNPDKMAALVRAGIQVVERIPCEVAGEIFAQGYRAKLRRAILDKNVTIPEDTTVGYDLAADRARGWHVTDSGIVVIGREQ